MCCAMQMRDCNFTSNGAHAGEGRFNIGGVARGGAVCAYNE